VSVVVPETAPLLAEGVKRLFGLGFKYVLQTLDYSARWESSHITTLRSQYRRLADFYFAALRKGRKIYYSPFDERIKTHAQKPYGPGDLCDLANTQIAIAPSGRIYPCVQFIGSDGPGEQKHTIGDVASGFDAAKRTYFVEQNRREKECCVGCALNGRCATFCGCVNWRATGSIDKIPAVICEHERMLMPIADELANSLWAKNVKLFKRKFYERTFPVSSYIEDCSLGVKHAADQADRQI
ncbi:MAG: SPASM domain-containing protein, partial [Candidatus Edwardsbacteria bacterium]|nr:SPASM domain-containing protein [Candidatus Edwardsbacteria bacterium]